MSRRRALSSERNAGRPFSRAERDQLRARLALMPPSRAAGFEDLASTAGGRARLRDAGYVARLSPSEVRAAAERGLGVPVVHGQPVDLDAVVRQLRRSVRGREVLRKHDLT